MSHTRLAGGTDGRGIEPRDWMRGIARLLQEHWRPVAVAACFLGLFWPVVQLGLYWAGLEESVDWLFRSYFIDQYFAAFALGLIVSRWSTLNIAPLGAVAAVIVTVGVRESGGDELTFDHYAAWALYAETALRWLWIAGLIALGILLSRRVGGLVAPTPRSDAPGDPAAG